MSIEPVGRRISVYSNGQTWSAALFLATGLPTRAAAEAAAGAFVSAYSAGWRDGLRDLITLWADAKMWVGETWGPSRITGWLLAAVERLAPGVAGGAA